MKVWVLLATHGTIIEYVPEVYVSQSLAEREARRWAWILAGEGAIRIHQPFPSRWEVGTRDVRLVEASWAADESGELDVWVGTRWSMEGFPDPEAVLLLGREDALKWVREDVESGGSVNVAENEWSVSATHGPRDEESYSVAHQAKIVFAARTSLGRQVEYEVQVTGTFVQEIRSTVTGPPGLTKADIEGLVESSWSEISGDTDVLLESWWELQSFHEGS